MSYQIQKRKEENPDDIDKVPVQADHLDGCIPCAELKRLRAAITISVISRPAPTIMWMRVHSGHREIQKEQDLRLMEVARVGILESRPGNVMVHPLLVIFDVLKAEEYAAQESTSEPRTR